MSISPVSDVIQTADLLRADLGKLHSSLNTFVTVWSAEINTMIENI